MIIALIVLLVFLFILLVAAISFVLAGLRRVPHYERWVIERFLKYDRTVGPGLVWLFPFIDTVRAMEDIREQPTDLFTENPWLDFKEGGTAQLVQPRVWSRIIGDQKDQEEKVGENVYKAVYAVKDWQVALREFVEQAFRNCINTLTPEEVLAVVSKKKTGWWEIIKETFPDIESKVESWGREVTKITVSDYRFSKEIIEARRQVFEQERRVLVAKFAADAAQYEALQKALQSGGTYGEIRRILTDPEGPYKVDPDKAATVAEELVKYFRGTEAGAIFDLRLSDLQKLGGIAQDIIPILLSLKGAEKSIGGKVPAGQRPTAKVEGRKQQRMKMGGRMYNVTTDDQGNPEDWEEEEEEG